MGRGNPTLYGPEKGTDKGEILERGEELNAEAEVIERHAELNVESGGYTVELPKNEIIVTTSLMFSGKYIMRNSSIYYINDPDWSQYVLKSKYQDPAIAQYRLVDK